ncbi:MAG: hypothetical protein K9G44_07935 [Melioribacteraceae bacterium]|nr:hypothetical protein [Melioribacteraceae bacterium]
MKQKFICIIAALFVFGSISNAQTLGGSLMLGFPQNEFKSNVDRLAYGFNLEGTLGSPGMETPVTIGASFGFMVYGEEDVVTPLSKTIGRVSVNVNTTNSLLNFHLMMKVSPFEGSVKPYLEGLAGGNYLFTESKVEDVQSGEEVVSSTNLDDFSWSYGAGGGILISLFNDRETSDAEILLDIKARYLYGTKAKYLAEGSIIEDGNGNVFYDISESTTDLLTIHVGVIFSFDLIF